MIGTLMMGVIDVHMVAGVFGGSGWLDGCIGFGVL